MASANKKQRTYNFNSEWEEDYCFSEQKGKTTCLLCNATVSVSKKSNVERHFNTVHSDVDKNFPPKSSMRKEKVKQLKSQLLAQQSLFVKKIEQNEAATIASFCVAKVLAKHKKPYQDGEIMKQAFIEAGEAVFEGFKNKTEIMAAIKSIPLAANTIMRRVDSMSSDIESQLKADLQECCFFFLFNLMNLRM